MNATPSSTPQTGRPYVPAWKHRKLRESRDRLKAGNLMLAKRLASLESRISLLEARLARSKRAGLASLADWQHEYIRALEALRLHPEQDPEALAGLRELRGRRP